MGPRRELSGVSASVYHLFIARRDPCRCPGHAARCRHSPDDAQRGPRWCRCRGTEPMVSDAPSRERLAAPASSLARGAPIGRYMVLGLVGRGAMGEVYAAYDPELDRKVAVKLLHAEGGNRPEAGELKSRLLR